MLNHFYLITFSDYSKVLLTEINPLKYVKHHLLIFAAVLK